MSRSLAQKGLSALLTLACAAAAFLVALDAPAPSRGPVFALTGAGGALTLQNDRAGVAIFQAANLRPGGVAEGVVTLSATGAGTSRCACAASRAPSTPARAAACSPTGLRSRSTT